MICPYCHGSGWICETHPASPIDHRLLDGSKCDGPWKPCMNPACQDAGKQPIEASFVRVEEDEDDG